MFRTVKRQFCQSLSPAAFGALFLVFLLLIAFRAVPAAADIYAFRGEGGILYYTNVPAEGRYKVRLPLRDKGMPVASVFQGATFEPMIATAGERFSVDPHLIRAIIKAESNFDPRAVSLKGASGLMQLMPGTAREMGMADPFDPEENIQGGAKYLSLLLNALNGNLPLALAAYNAGPGRVFRYNKIPPIPETLNYVELVLNYYEALKRGYQSEQP
ncbi:MAG: lytic transglycosylase [Syntrophobacteraceae bacterium CG23_combo_of_CG06-09_8_20_14_all_50_8]|nr:MAG: lytic transglycosylase [Syntrophobacteraceae bacterium CG23_combo_of_CG06-09_8_20_14_all_50_8]